MAIQATESQSVLDRYLANETAKTQAAQASKNTSQTGLSADYNTFLKLLTAQLQYQDPLAPTDANEYTKQLVSFSQVEQSIKSNDKLDALIALQQKNTVSGLLDYMGKYVEAESDFLPLQNGKGQIGYTLPTVAGDVKINIKDENGTVVATLDGDRGVGRHYVTWDGMDGNVKLPDGKYKYEVVAKDAKDKPIILKDVFIVGQVTSIANGADGVALFLGQISLPDSKVAALRNGLV
jgi:flagellar basal-body rod modification protein FlgD